MCCDAKRSHRSAAGFRAERSCAHTCQAAGAGDFIDTDPAIYHLMKRCAVNLSYQRSICLLNHPTVPEQTRSPRLKPPVDLFRPNGAHDENRSCGRVQAHCDKTETLQPHHYHFCQWQISLFAVVMRAFLRERIKLITLMTPDESQPLQVIHI